MKPTRILSMASVADRFGRNPKRAGQEVGLEDGFEDELRRLLAHPVLHRRDAQRALATRRALESPPGELAAGR